MESDIINLISGVQQLQMIRVRARNTSQEAVLTSFSVSRRFAVLVVS